MHLGLWPLGSPQRAARKSLGIASVLVMLGIGLAACTIGDPQAQEASETEAVQEEVAPKVSIKDGATGVNPTADITVESGSGELKDVTMTNENGKEVEASYSDDRTEWSTDEVLGYGRYYTIEAKNSNGKTTTVEFSTVAPAATVNAYVMPSEGMTVGIGQTINFTFSNAISDKDAKEAVEKAITIKTTPEVEGAFYWLGATELRWRPKDYWEPGTEVSVDADLYGVKLSDGIYGADDYSSNFTIGDAMRAVVDDNTKTMTIYKNGEEIKSMPVSLGMNAFPTYNGVYMVGDRVESMIMDSTTYGLSLEDGGYRQQVSYATQLSYSGIYVHAAPWSVWAQGSSNQSHGCINVNTENAKWFMDNFKRGDIVEVKNTVGSELPGWDGLGSWNVGWEDWKAGGLTNK